MSAVVEAVGDLVGGVVEAVGDAVEWVGDTVSNVVESVMDDPLKAVVQVAAVATGNAWALPIIEGVDVLEEGGDLGDALKAAAVTYAVQTGVNFAMDSFAAAGPTADVGSGTTQFFDDGSSIQFFDDGSRLVTDTAGNISASAATDVAGAAAASGTASQAVDSVFDEAFSAASKATSDVFDWGSNVVEDVLDIFDTDSSGRTWVDRLLDPVTGERIPTITPDGVVGGFDDFVGPMPVAESFPVADVPAPMPGGDVTGSALQAADEVAAAGASPTYNTMEDLLLDKGAITQQQYDDLVSNAATSISTTLPDAVASPSYGTMEELLLDKGLITPEQAVAAATPPDPYANLPESVGSAVAVEPNAPQYATMEDLLYDKGQLTDAQYKDLTGVAPVVDRSIAFDPNVADVPLTDALKNLGQAGLEYAKENPFTTAGIIGGGLALAGAGEQAAPTTPGEPAKKTYTYGAPPPIRRTGLSQLYSAAENIYGPRGAAPTPGSTLPPNVQFQSSFQPLLGGGAPGASRVGLGALGQGFSYTPMGSPQTFDISALTPEQIVQLQDAMARRRAAGGG